MTSLHLQGVKDAHTSAAVILDGAHLDLAAPAPTEPRPFAGVAAANGVGNTTLLRLLAGQLNPTAGSTEVQADMPPRLVLQDVGDLSTDVRRFAWQWGGEAVRLRRRLRLDPDDLDPSVGRGWTALSPGAARKVALAPFPSGPRNRPRCPRRGCRREPFEAAPHQRRVRHGTRVGVPDHPVCSGRSPLGIFCGGCARFPRRTSAASSRDKPPQRSVTRPLPATTPVHAVTHPYIQEGGRRSV